MTRRTITGIASIKAAASSVFTMPECAAHTHVQRALHALILEDNNSAAGYLRRALFCLEEGRADQTMGKRRRGFSREAEGRFALSWD